MPVPGHRRRKYIEPNWPKLQVLGSFGQFDVIVPAGALRFGKPITNRLQVNNLPHGAEFAGGFPSRSITMTSIGARPDTNFRPNCFSNALASAVSSRAPDCTVECRSQALWGRLVTCSRLPIGSAVEAALPHKNSSGHSRSPACTGL